MRLNRLKLENFRCFRQQEFDLSADILAIYGRNGTGKTALFDALEFCLAGEIGRFANAAVPPQYLVNAYASAGTKVRLEVGMDERHWIEVGLNDDTSVVNCSDGSKSRKDFFFAHLVDEDYLLPRREFDPLVELFRATILLSQETVRNFVEAKASERSGLIANLVGAAYLQRCLEKARNVTAEGKRRLKAVDSEIAETLPQLQEIETQIKEREGRLAALNVSVHGERINIERLLISFSALSPDEAHNISEPTVDPDHLAGLLAGFAEDHLVKVRVQLTALTEIATLLPQHSTRLHERDALTRRLENLREAYARSSANVRAMSEGVAVEQAAAEVLRLATDSLTNEYNRLIRLFQLLKARAHVDESEVVLRQKLQTLEREQSSATQAVVTLEASVSEAVNRSELKAGDFLAASARIVALEQIHAELQDHEMRQQLITTHREESQRAAERIELLAVDREKLHIEESALLRKSEELARRSVTAASEDAGVTAAILTLRTHSKDGVCPLCGYPHASQDDLRREIDARLSGIPAAASRFQREGEEIDQQKASVRAKLAIVDDEIAQLRRQRDNAGRQIELLLQTSRGLEEKALRVSASLERAALEHTLASQRDAAVVIKTELGLAQAETKSIQQQLLEARAGSAVLSERVAADRSLLDQLLIQKSEINRQINRCEPVGGEGEAAIEAAQERLVAKRGEYEAKLAATAAMQRDLSAEHERGSELGRSVNAVERALIETTNAISSVTARLRSLELREDASSDQLRQIQAAAEANERKALELSDLLERFKAQLKRDVLERERNELRRQEAELASIKQRLQHSRNQIEAASAEAATWEAKLAQRVKDSVSHRLNQHRIESFRLFQSMIPAPYLFEDITVAQAEDGVRLGLRYRDVFRDVGEPRYFLSSAQANVLALSYFLSFACRQRWCKLRTVLMDDPVQHLDDLDAVAFLDIVRSLVISSVKPRRQMIISTCDYNLYALMIRKFSCLPPDQLRFAALSLHDISADGPIVRYDYGETSNVRAA